MRVRSVLVTSAFALVAIGFGALYTISLTSRAEAIVQQTHSKIALLEAQLRELNQYNRVASQDLSALWQFELATVRDEGNDNIMQGTAPVRTFDAPVATSNENAGAIPSDIIFANGNFNHTQQTDNEFIKAFDFAANRMIEKGSETTITAQAILSARNEAQNSTISITLNIAIDDLKHLATVTSQAFTKTSQSMRMLLSSWADEADQI